MWNNVSLIVQFAIALCGTYMTYVTYRRTKWSLNLGGTKAEVLSSDQGALGLRFGLIGIVCILLGSLPEWASQTPVLKLLDESLRNSIAMFANYSVLACLIGVVLLSANRIRSIATALWPPSKGRKKADLWLRLFLLALLASYIIIVIQALAKTRIWAGNQDTLVIWLLALLANVVLVMDYVRFRSLLAILGCLIIGFAVYNLWGLCQLEAGDVSWALETGVLPGMYSCVVGGFLLGSVGFRRWKLS